MPWTGNLWAYKEIPSSAKLNLSEADTALAREEAASKLIAALPYFEMNHTIYSSINYEVEIDGVQVGTAVTAFGKTVLADIDLSAAGISVGVHELTLSTPAGPFLNPLEIMFVRTADLNFLTIWIRVDSPVGGSINVHKISNLNIIGHRVAKSWT